MCCEKSPTGEHRRIFPIDEKMGVCQDCGEVKHYPSYNEIDDKELTHRNYRNDELRIVEMAGF